MNKFITEIKKEMQDLSSNWNGKDEQFIHDGFIYHEEHASCAQDIVKKCEELEELLEFMNE